MGSDITYIEARNKDLAKVFTNLNDILANADLEIVCIQPLEDSVKIQFKGFDFTTEENECYWLEFSWDMLIGNLHPNVSYAEQAKSQWKQAQKDARDAAHREWLARQELSKKQSEEVKLKRKLAQEAKAARQAEFKAKFPDAAAFLEENNE